MKKLITITVIIVCNISIKSYCQSNQTSTSIYYKPPTNVNGLTPVKVDFTYKVVNVFGTIQIIYIAKCTGDLAYQYQGRVWTFTGADAAVRKVVAKEAVVDVIVTGPNGLRKEMKLWAISETGGLSGNSSDVVNAKTPEEKNPSNYTVTVLQVSRVSYDNVWDIQNQLEAKIQSEKNAKILDDLIRKADYQMQMLNYSEAEALFNNAGKIDKNNDYVKNQIAIAKKKREQANGLKAFDEIMNSAQNAEKEGDLSKAERLYDDASMGEINKDVAQNALRRVRNLKEAKTKEIEKQKSDELKELENKNKKTQDANDKKRNETLKNLKEKDLEAQELLKAKMDSIANELGDAERKNLKALQEKFYKEKAENEKIEDEKQKNKDKAENDLIKAKNKELIEEYEGEMNFDAEMYYPSIKYANELYEKALEINPWDELELKREWWDNNNYIQYFADDLYENQRQENHKKYLAANSEAKVRFYTAKYKFLNTLKYVDRNSYEHKSLLQKINMCDTEIRLYEITWLAGFKDERVRIEQREQARIMKESQIIIDNRQKAALAFSALDGKAAFTAEYLVQKYELADRMNIAHQKYVQAMAVAGISQSVTMNLITNNDTTVDGGRVFGLINASAFTGYTSLPILLNETADNELPITTINDLAVIDANFGLDCWVARTKNFDLNIGMHAGYGLYPSTSSSSVLLNYGGKINLDYGFKRFKIVNTFEYIKRVGEMEIDYDIQSAENNFNIVSPNRKATGNFNYEILRIGTGIKIDFGDNSDASHLLFNVFLEKPSFYMANSSFSEFLKKPIYSLQAEYMVFGGFTLSVAYAKNYAIAGDKKHTILELKNKDYIQLRIGKYWTIFNPKKS